MAAPARFASPSSAAAPPRVAPPSVASRAVVASRRASSAPRAVAAALLSGHRRLPVPRPPSHARAPASAQPREHLRAWRGCIPPGAKKHATFRTAAAAATTTTTDSGGGGEGDLVDGEPRDVAYDAETETRDAHRRLSRYDVLLMTPEDRAKVHKLKCFEGRVRAAEKRKRQMVESIEGEVFRPRERIKSQADFNRVGMRGFNWNGKLVRVQWLRNAHVKDVTCTRIGIKTPKKQIKLAVHRNLVKRRVRDIFRKNKAEWPEKCDFVVYCGAAAKEAEYAALKSEMLYWAREVAPGFEKQNAGPQHQGYGGKKQGGKKRAAQPGSKADRRSE